MTMSSNETTTGKLTDADLRQIYGRYIHLNGMNDYPGQMHAGFTYAMIPALEDYADNEETCRGLYPPHERVLQRDPVCGRPAARRRPRHGGAERSGSRLRHLDHHGHQTALMGPLSAIGDTVFHATLRVIATAVVISMASAGNIAGPILFMLIFNIPSSSPAG